MAESVREAVSLDRAADVAATVPQNAPAADTRRELGPDRTRPGASAGLYQFPTTGVMFGGP
jgi:hypothetical protein